MEKGRILVGDCRESMRQMIADGVKVQMCVTSPPYYGLRDYGHPDQLGLEETPEQYIANMVEVFRLVKDLLTDDGVLWLNIGDSYCGGRGGDTPKQQTNRGTRDMPMSTVPVGMKAKDLMGIPWMLAFALRADGWYLRQDIIWHKPNPMPESVIDRCTKSHEYVFMLTKSKKYYYNHHAIKTPYKTDENRPNGVVRNREQNYNSKTNNNPEAYRMPVGKIDKQRGHSRRHAGFNDRWDAMTKEEQQSGGANKRSVWHVATKPYKGAHFATFPPELIEPCVLAGSRPGDTVLDPFGGAGTTGLVSRKHGRNYILCELNSEYIKLAQDRIANGCLKILGQLL